MAIELVDLPIEHGGFSIVMLVYQGVSWFIKYQGQTWTQMPVDGS
jgi:hypothetical protein